MRTVIAIALAFLVAVLPATSAQALSPSGSHGWSRAPLELRAGPGRQYDITGQIPGLVAIKILRCQKLWCVVDGPGGRGWTGIGKLDFGTDPQGEIFDANKRWRDLTNGEVCFFTGANYTGSAFCAKTGSVFPDLKPSGWDNAIRSVKIIDPTSATLCRDRNFQSYCERITQSQPVVAPLLNRTISSIRVY